MPRACSNCAHWSSTDRVWGDCTYVERTDALAQVRENDDGSTQELETQYGFRCIAWKTLRTSAAAR